MSIDFTEYSNLSPEDLSNEDLLKILEAVEIEFYNRMGPCHRDSLEELLLQKSEDI